MTPTEERSGWRLAPRWLKLLLVISLSLNVAVIGLVGGYAIRHGLDDNGFGRMRAEPGLTRQQTRILSMVPEARHDMARNVLLARQTELDAARETMRAAQGAFIDALRKEPLDRDRLAAALAERQTAAGQMWGIGFEQMVEIASQLNAAERAEMAARLEELTRRWLERQERRGR